MKIKKALALIFMMLFFIIGYGESEIPNTLITQNPEREVTTVKTNRRKEFGEFNIEINKVISKEIQGMVDPTQRTIFFDMGHLEKPITENDLIFVTEELEVFPSVAETNGQKRWSNVMEKYKKSYKDKTPVENNGLKYTFEVKTDEVDNSVSKTLKVFYMSPPETLYIGVVDKESYEVKAIYKFLASSAILKTNTVVGKANAVFTNEAFDLMRADKVNGEYIKEFEQIKIIKEKGKLATVESNGQKYFTLSPRDEAFLDTPDFTKIEKIKITNIKNNMSLEISKDQMPVLPLSDGSVFKIKYTSVSQSKIEITVIPIIFGSNPEANFKIEFLDNKGSLISSSILDAKFPNITHEGIGISSKDGTKNSLAPENTYEIGSEDNKIVENLQINPEQKNYLSGKIGLEAEGKNIRYLFYLLKIKQNLELSFISEDGDNLQEDKSNNKYTFIDKNDTQNKNTLEFTVDKTQNKLIMKVPYWDMTKIQKTFSIEVKSNGKAFYKIPLHIWLPETKRSEGRITVTYYSKYEEQFTNVGEKIDLIKPNIDFEYADITVDGQYPFSQNLVGAKKYFINGAQEEKNFGMKYSEISLINLDSVKIESKYDIGNNDGFSIGFKKKDWENLLSSKASGNFSVSFRNYYDLEIGKYNFDISANPKRKAIFTINNILGCFVGPVQNENSITTGRIFGFSNHVPYSEEDTTGLLQDKVRKGKILGSNVIGDELRYYGLEGGETIEIEVAGKKITSSVLDGTNISATENIDIGFVEREYLRREIVIKEKALYFKLKNYDGTKALKQTINLTVLRNKMELFRDTIEIDISAIDNNQTDIEFKIINYDGYLGQELRVDGGNIVNKNGEVYGSINITNGKGKFPIDLTDVETYDCEYWLSKKDNPKKTILNENISNLKSGKTIEYKEDSYFNKIKLMIGDNEDFYFEVPNEKMYLNIIIKFTFKDKDGKVKKIYQLSFYEVSNPSVNTNISNLDIKIKNIDEYISKYILKDVTNEELQIKSEASQSSAGKDPKLIYNGNIYDVGYRTFYEGIRNIFIIGEDNCNYKFYENTQLVGIGIGDKNENSYQDGKFTSVPKIKTTTKIEFTDGGEILFGFSRDRSFVENQGILLRLTKVGDKLYSGEYTYKTEIHQMNPNDKTQGITKVNLTIPKIDYSNKKVEISANKKNGLCPKFPYYFGTGDGIFNDGIADSELSDHATKDFLKISGGNIPYLILRANEIPVTDIGNFIALESLDGGKVISMNGKYIVDYSDKQQIIFEIVGNRGDSFTKNKIKMIIPKWDESAINKNLKFKVYNKSRKGYFEVPIKIQIGATSVVRDEEIRIELNEEYRKKASVYGEKFSFYEKNIVEGKDEFIIKINGSTEEIGKLISNPDKFTPIRTTEETNILLGGINLEVEADGKTTFLGKGGIFDISGFSVYVGYDNNSNNKTGRLEMATEKWANNIEKKFKLRIKNDYGVTVAEYNVTISGEGNQLKDEALFNFGVVNSAMKHLETTVIKEIPLNEVVSDIKVEFSNKNPILTLNGKALNDASEDEKLYVTNFDIRYAEKDRIDPKKWHIKVSGFLAPLTSTDKKKEGKYTCPDPIFMSITVKDSTKGTREIKE